jgi:Cu/Ag efflux pump CusA
MRRGEQSMPTIRRVEQEVERINAATSFRPVCGSSASTIGELIDITTRTVLHNMVFGIGLIFLLQWVFLGNLRSAIIVGTTFHSRCFRRRHPGDARWIRKSPVGRRHRFGLMSMPP